MLKKQVLLSTLVMVFFISSCDKSNQTSNINQNNKISSLVQGIDQTGSYVSNSVACFNPKTRIMSTSENLISGQETLEITGNKLVSTTRSKDCEVVVTGDVVFKTATSYDIKNRKILSATGGACFISFEIGSIPANRVAPDFLRVEYKTGNSLGDIQDGYYEADSSNKNFGLYVFYYTNKDVSSDSCFLIYSKQ